MYGDVVREGSHVIVKDLEVNHAVCLVMRDPAKKLISFPVSCCISA